MKRLTLLGLLVVAIFASLIGTLPMAIEEPKFTIVRREGDYEIRDYQEAVAAEVTVTGDQTSAGGKGFRLLAGYIFGGNARRQGIAMTAPVALERASEKIAMTAPVTQTRSEGAWVVRFTMPSSYSLATLPEPKDSRVKLRSLAPARFAVLRFSGRASKASVEAKAADLVAFVNKRQIRATGAVSLAQYNPPWTLWFMRRNEVMVQLEP